MVATERGGGWPAPSNGAHKHLLRTPHWCRKHYVDYCSQLFMPAGQSQDMTKIEKWFYDFTSKIPEFKQQNYWQRLKSMKMYSQVLTQSCSELVKIMKANGGCRPILIVLLPLKAES